MIANRKSHTTIAATVLALALSSNALGEVPPRILSEESVAVVPDIESQCEEGFHPAASCGTGLSSASFLTVSGGNRYCSPVGSETEPSVEGITCEVDNDGTIRWSFNPEDADTESEPTIPSSISSVVLARCGFNDEEFFLPTSAYTYLYGPFGATADAELKLFGDIGDAFGQIQPFEITFCYDDASDPQPVTTPEIPVCHSGSGVCGSADGETYLVEVSRLRGPDGEVLQPPAALDGETCVCGPDGTQGPLTQCDPAAGEGDPNACRVPEEGAPGQVTRMDQWNGDPYFCTTQNGRRRCFSY